MRELRPPARTRPYTGATPLIVPLARSWRRAQVEIAFPAFLRDQTCLADHDVVRQRLAHVVYREGGDARARECFHFHAGLVVYGHGASDYGRIADQFDDDLAAFDPERMAERYELMCTLGAHDTRDDRGIENRSFGGAQSVLTQRLGDLRWKTHGSFRNRSALPGGLVADIDHRRSAIRIQMRKCHGFSRRYNTFRFSWPRA